MSKKEELSKLIRENPDRKLVFFVGEDVFDGFCSAMCENFGVKLADIYIFNERAYDDKESALADFMEYYAEDERYINMPDKEYEEMCDRLLEEEEHFSAIVVTIYE